MNETLSTSYNGILGWPEQALHQWAELAFVCVRACVHACVYMCVLCAHAWYILANILLIAYLCENSITTIV